MKKLILAAGVISCLSFGVLVPACGMRRPCSMQAWQQKRADTLRQMIIQIPTYDQINGTDYVGLLEDEGVPHEAFLAQEETERKRTFDKVSRKFRVPEQLFVWCLSKNLDLGLYLLTSVFGDNISVFNPTSLMMYACATGNIDAIRGLESLGVECDPTTMGVFVDPKGEVIRCNILLPAAIGGLGVLDYLYVKGIDVFSDTGCPYMSSIFATGCRYGRNGFLIHFIEKDYDLLNSGAGTIKDCRCITYRNGFWTFLDCILECRCSEALDLFMKTLSLLPRRIQTKLLRNQLISDERTILSTAAEYPEAVKLLTQYGLLEQYMDWQFLKQGHNGRPVSDFDDDPETVWKIFVEKGDYENIQPILQYVLSDEFVKWQGLTELHKLVLNGDTEELLYYLLENPRIDINAQDRNKNTALHLAASFGLSEIVQILLGVEGIDLCSEGQDEKSPIEMAVRLGQTNVVSLLLSDERFMDYYLDHQMDYHLVADAIAGGHINIALMLLNNPCILIDDEVFEVLVSHPSFFDLNIILLLQRNEIDIYTECDQAGNSILKYVLKALTKVFMGNREEIIGDRSHDILLALREYCQEASINPDKVVAILQKVMDELKVNEGELGKAQRFILSVLSYLCPDIENDDVPNMYEFLPQIEDFSQRAQVSLLTTIYGCRGSIGKLMPMMDFIQYAQDQSYTKQEMLYVLYRLYIYPEIVENLPDIRELLLLFQQLNFSIDLQHKIIRMVGEIWKKQQADGQPTIDEIAEAIFDEENSINPIIQLMVLYKYGGVNKYSELVPMINEFIPVIKDTDPDSQNSVIQFMQVLYKEQILSDRLCEVPLLLQAMQEANLDIETQLDILNNIYKTSGRFAELLASPDGFDRFANDLSYTKLEYLRLLNCLYGIEELVAEDILSIFDLMQFMQQDECDLGMQLNILREFYVHPEIEELQELIPGAVDMVGFMQVMLELGYDQQSQIEILRALYSEIKMENEQLLDTIVFMRETEYSLETQLTIISILFHFSDPEELILFIKMTDYASEAKRIFKDQGLEDYYNEHKGRINYMFRE